MKKESLEAIAYEIHKLNQLSYAITLIALESNGLTEEQSKNKIKDLMNEYDSIL